jgi:histidine triad (HIT) family protein
MASSSPAPSLCVFDQIRDGQSSAEVVLDEPDLLAFLDVRPVFPGHTLVVPRLHIETLAELPEPLLGPLFGAARRVAAALEEALGAEGAFIGLNNVISQSVPHVHLHVIPRRRKDGLRGFFWPRQRYPDDEAMKATGAALRGALASP